LSVDATDASKGILHARLRIPVRPGALTLVYPKWIPGEHGPTGPITDLAGLKFSIAGAPLAWERDAEDMFAFHVEVPTGAKTMDVTLDFLLPQSPNDFTAGGSATTQLLDLSWNQVVLYPKGSKPGELLYTAEVKLPKGWKLGTALPVAHRSGDLVEFGTVSIEELVDSPVIAGAHFNELDLTPGARPAYKLNIVADSAAALEMKPEDRTNFMQLPREANALFGATHFRNYHFLLTLSDHVAHFGLEHHESSDNRMVEKFLTDSDSRELGASLLPHEMVHSWNGKYRRPAGLATADFEQPMKGELLWVYEGLTDYLGEVLATRSGLVTNKSFRDDLALAAAMLDHREGRKWRPLADTTIAAQLLYGSRGEWRSWRRDVDFYPEGALIWLEADVIIRQQTHGARSLDDFCRAFFGGESGPPKVVPYTREDVIAERNKITPYDWTHFFQTRVYDINPQAPLGGIEGSGWHLAYTNEPSETLKMSEGARKYTDLNYSLGFTLGEDGTTRDVIPESPAAKAGIAPAMKLVAVNGRRWTPEILREAVKSGTNSAPLELLVENQDFFKICKVDYHEGEKYPVLQRDKSKPDLLTEILKPLVK
jgi:predicted metalloprotease with PDZ domain